MAKSPEGSQPNPNLGERAFRFDARLGRAVGFTALIAATGGAFLGAASFAGGAALVAGGSFFGAEVSDRIANSFKKKSNHIY